RRAPRHPARFDQRLPLPKLGALFLMLPKRLLADHQGALVARRAQPRVDGVEVAFAQLELHQVQKPLHPSGEVLVVGKLAARSARRFRVPRAAVNEDEIQIRPVASSSPPSLPIPTTAKVSSPNFDRASPYRVRCSSLAR